MQVKEFAAAYLADLKAAVDALDIDAISPVIDVLLEAKRERRSVYVVGNGGSAATATHLASDLCRTEAGTGRRGLRAVSLTDNVSAFTAMANDTSYEQAFAELLALHVAAGDVVIAISGSGNSPNILAAVDVARARGAKTIGIVGFGGGALAERVDLVLCLGSRNYGVVEDLHLAMAHIISMFLAGPERMEHPDRRPGSSLGVGEEEETSA